MSSLQGYLPENTTYAELKEMFGESICWDNYKSDAEWEIVHEGNTINIYNYKTGKNYLGAEGLPVEEITDWHVGAETEEIGKSFIEWFKKNRTLNNKTEPLETFEE